MSWYSQITKNGVNTASLTGNATNFVVTAGNETLKVTTPSGMSAALLTGQKMSALQPQNEVWAPLGLFYTVSVAIAAAAAKVTLRKNGVSAATGGVATLAAVGATTTVLFAPFTAWTFAAAPAAGDQWSVLVTTVADTTGTLTPVLLAYVTVGYIGVTDGIAM